MQNERNWCLAPKEGSRFSRPSFCHSAFRSNNAYIGIPVMQFAFSGRPDIGEMSSLAMLTLAPCMILYNVLAVAILTKTDDTSTLSRRIVKMLAGMARNPLILASVTGVALLVV